MRTQSGGHAFAAVTGRRHRVDDFGSTASGRRLRMDEARLASSRDAVADVAEFSFEPIARRPIGRKITKMNSLTTQFNLIKPSPAPIARVPGAQRRGQNIWNISIRREIPGLCFRGETEAQTNDAEKIDESNTVQERAKPQAGVNTQSSDGSSRVDQALATARSAQALYADYTQEQVDAIFKAAALAANMNRIPLAKLAVEETGIGLVEDKVIKVRGYCR